MVSNSYESLETDLKALKPWETALFALMMIAMVFPPAFQAILTFFLMIWLLFNRPWRFLPQSLMADEAMMPIMRVLAWTLMATAGVHVVCLILQLIVSSQSWEHLVKSHFKLLGKQGLWGAFIFLAFQVAQRRGLQLSIILKAFVFTLFLLVLYMLAQRYWGIDWVHGFSAKLPSHRFAYGVYRSSGFMAHPLTLGFNMMLVSLFCFGAARTMAKDKKQKFWWYSGAALAFCGLALTGSRYPLALCGIFLVIQMQFGGVPIRRRLFAIALIIGLSLGVMISMKGRFEEVLDQERDWRERVPRLVFWEVHWQMFKDHPLIGVGYSQKSEQADHYYNRMGYENFDRKYSAHNIYLQTLADMGILGFLSLISIFCGLSLAAFQMWRRWRNPTLGIIVLSTAVAGLMQNILRDSEFLSAFWVSLSILIFLQQKIGPNGRQVESRQSREN